ncbi:unnamed protein product [Angiostrongylus costaricensis]|uniref:Flocculation protein FLO11-like n=1 Tax=Angiostrongylus costaricensis TaxID=334426 RepID=A0A0R3PMM3_ANGCS|nr:unnamed protein product [Angiostrongylus costaricensis]
MSNVLQEDQRADGQSSSRKVQKKDQFTVSFGLCEISGALQCIEASSRNSFQLLVLCKNKLYMLFVYGSFTSGGILAPSSQPTVKSKSSISDEEVESRKSKAAEQSARSSKASLSRRGAPISPLTPVERTSENASDTPSSGEPTPYNANPPVNLMTAKSGSVDARASIAPAVPVGVGEEQNVQSTYFSLPKPVGKQTVPSVRLPPNQRKSSQRSKVTPLNVAPAPVDERKKISSDLSTYINLPK